MINMLHRTKYLLISLVLLLIPFLLLVAPPALAACNDPNLSTKEAIQCGVNNASGTDKPPAEPTKTFNQTLATIINLLSVIVGIVAVIMIIMGGFRYITSGGSQEKVTSAKNTILYAVIGLVVVALAQVIVRFVLSEATRAPK